MQQPPFAQIGQTEYVCLKQHEDQSTWPHRCGALSKSFADFVDHLAITHGTTCYIQGVNYCLCCKIFFVSQFQAVRHYLSHAKALEFAHCKQDQEMADTVDAQIFETIDTIHRKMLAQESASLARKGPEEDPPMDQLD